MQNDTVNEEMVLGITTTEQSEASERMPIRPQASPSSTKRRPTYNLADLNLPAPKKKWTISYFFGAVRMFSTPTYCIGITVLLYHACSCLGSNTFKRNITRMALPGFVAGGASGFARDNHRTHHYAL